LLKLERYRGCRTYGGSSEPYIPVHQNSAAARCGGVDV
jgi:hypothetical protein